ncbi:hypothetical protein Q6348_12970 [Isoptericola sp. b441]|uniref:Lipoprotein n=1 Tax=Actinotalea lenta TaxID=3064654 RepID=A0ABT9DB32_9CELL|nr:MULTISPECIES: hypothetical protein [unclassified Isoptericola]MDO8108107.1 hypothetical protein [Isoptericola sp. b441]MDO8120223.1 hypothetical protein [Isoptericola sp. b490]
MRIVLVVPALLALALTACASGEAEGSASSADGVALLQTTTMVAGTQHCTWDSPATEGDPLVTRVRFVCQNDLSDARVSGTEELTLVWLALGEEQGQVWVTESASLTTSGGTWTGTGAGVFDLVGVLPTSPGLAPYNYGSVRYVGEGAYEGLEYQEFIAGTDTDLALAGWIRTPG